jgi:hypothetical protein
MFIAVFAGRKISPRQALKLQYVSLLEEKFYALLEKKQQNIFLSFNKNLNLESIKFLRNF